MKGDIIPNEDHIARYCRPMQIDDGQIKPSAFLVRKNEPFLSANWLEILNCPSRKKEIAELRNIYAGKLHVGANAKIAVLQVGEVKKKVFEESDDKRALEIKHNPEDNDHSYSGIYNLKHDDIEIARLILKTLRQADIYQARQ
jgi:hypothetical protein